MRVVAAHFNGGADRFGVAANSSRRRCATAWTPLSLLMEGAGIPRRSVNPPCTAANLFQSCGMCAVTPCAPFGNTLPVDSCRVGGPRCAKIAFREKGPFGSEAGRTQSNFKREHAKRRKTRNTRTGPVNLTEMSPWAAVPVKTIQVSSLLITRVAFSQASRKREQREGQTHTLTKNIRST